MAALAGALLAVWLVVRGSGEPGDERRVAVVLDEAVNVVRGQLVRDAGGRIGVVDAIEPADRGRRARVTLRIDEERAWPLREGTRVTLRFGGTASFYNRYFFVQPGRPDGRPIPAAGTLPAKAVETPREWDEVLRALDHRTRRELKGLVDRAGDTVWRAGRPLGRALRHAPDVVREADRVMRDIGADSRALSRLVVSADRVVDAIDRAEPGIGQLISSAAETFDAVADRQDELRRTLTGLPGALSQMRSTLGNVDRTLARAGDVIERLDPGVDELRAIAGPLDRLLATVVDVTPDADAVLATADRYGPDVSQLLSEVVDESPRLTSIARQADKELACVRPYTPELVNLLTTWGDWMSVVDERDRYLRANIQNFLPASANSLPYDPGTAAKLFPGLRYGFPRPPGYLAGQPWFLPECGAGPDAIDPTKDPEARKPPTLPEARR